MQIHLYLIESGVFFAKKMIKDDRLYEETKIKVFATTGEIRANLYKDSIEKLPEHALTFSEDEYMTLADLYGTFVQLLTTKEFAEALENWSKEQPQNLS